MLYPLVSSVGLDDCLGTKVRSASGNGKFWIVVYIHLNDSNRFSKGGTT